MHKLVLAYEETDLKFSSYFLSCRRNLWRRLSKQAHILSTCQI